MTRDNFAKSPPMYTEICIKPQFTYPICPFSETTMSSDHCPTCLNCHTIKADMPVSSQLTADTFKSNNKIHYTDVNVNKHSTSICSDTPNCVKNDPPHLHSCVTYLKCRDSDPDFNVYAQTNKSVNNVNSSLLVCNNSNIFTVSTSNIVNCEHHHNFHHAEQITNVTFNNVNTMMEVNTAVNDVTDYSDVNRHHTKLSILSLNVCGLRSKLIIPYVLLFISQYDILCFVESKTDETDNKPDLIPGYTSYFNNRIFF